MCYSGLQMNVTCREMKREEGKRGGSYPGPSLFPLLSSLFISGWGTRWVKYRTVPGYTQLKTGIIWRKEPAMRQPFKIILCGLIFLATVSLVDLPHSTRADRNLNDFIEVSVATLLDTGDG